MIELIHKYPVLIRIMLGLVTLAFVLTGGWFWSKEDKQNYAAKVNGVAISRTEYDSSLSRMNDFYRQLYQGNMPEELFKKLKMEERALDSLVDREILLQEAAKQGVVVSDDEVSKAITSDTNFRGEGGGFDQQRYVGVLKSNGYTPVSYEARLREDLVIEKMRRMVKDSVYITEADIKDAYMKQIAQQKKAFNEEEYKAQRDNLLRMQTMFAQERVMSSFMETLRKGYQVEKNPELFPPAAAAPTAKS